MSATGVSAATFDELYRRHGRDVYRYSFYLSGNAAMAEDIASDSFGVCRRRACVRAAAGWRAWYRFNIGPDGGGLLRSPVAWVLDRRAGGRVAQPNPLWQRNKPPHFNIWPSR